VFESEMDGALVLPPQAYDGLLVRANVAKADTEEALRGIKTNMKGVDDSLASLRGTSTVLWPWCPGC